MTQIGQSENQSPSASPAMAARRSFSASLPIEVPAPQVKRNFNRLKLNNMLADRELGAESEQSNTIDRAQATNMQASLKDETKPEPPKSGRLLDLPFNNVFGGHDELIDDEFLDQEYNENHQNHYRLNEWDHDHLRAGEDPMRIFASIQALAKSLHEDAELFGSLPPKRLLESPIRSLALA